MVKIRQVTNITREQPRQIANPSVLDISIRIKGKTEILTCGCGQLRSVNDHSERRADKNCCEGQHIAEISNAAAVKNRVYFWEGVVVLCESFPNVKLTKRGRDYKPSGLRLAFLKHIWCPKMSESKKKQNVLGVQTDLRWKRENNKTQEKRNRCECLFDVSRRIWKE